MNLCHCIAIDGRFELLFESLDCKTLRIQDLSDWLVGDTYEKPASYTIQVVLPHSVKKTELVVKTEGVNVYTMKDFGLGDSDFINGIYCIIAPLCDGEFKTYRALLCKAQCCYNTFIAERKIEELEDEINTLELVDRLIKAIPIAAEIGEIAKAEEFMLSLHKELKRLNCNC